MSPLTLENRLRAAPPETRQAVDQVLAEIGHRTPRGRFLEKLLQIGLQLSQPVKHWADLQASDDLGSVVDVLTQPEVLEVMAPADPLAVYRLQGLRLKQQLLQHSGQPALSSDQAAQLLGVSREAVNKRRRNHQLIAVSLGKRGYRYPGWQFQEGKVLPGMPEVLEALEFTDEWTPVLFLCSGDPRLGGATPLSRLQAGDLAAILEAAHSYGQPDPA